MEVARKKTIESDETELKESKEVIEDTLKRIDDTLTEELIIGLCGPIGTDIHNVSNKIKVLLESEYNYTVEVIHLSKLIEKNTDEIFKKQKGASKDFVRMKDLILRGNKLRKDKSKSILAELAIKNIGIARQVQKKKNDNSARRICYIIDSIKNINELRLLKNVYRELFYFFGVFSPKDKRVENLKNRGVTEKEIYELIHQDSGEEIATGQSVAKTFILADFFIRIDNNIRKPLEEKLKRYFHLIFDTDIVTPYPEETAMYYATSAASNSACLSRQVGAAITDKNGDLLSVGWNDVPKFGGSVYRSQKHNLEGSNDFRCKCLDPKKCFNSSYKENIFNELSVEILSLNKTLIDKIITELAIKYKDKFTKKEIELIEALSKDLFNDKVESVIKNSAVKDLIEFSRSIHAEMHAIIVGAQKNADRMVEGKLFCTTFPCHNCARHIVMAGIHEVYFIEPYSKSLAEKLHWDSISSGNTSENKVRIRMYDGVSPNRYIDLFKSSKDNRKDDPIPNKEAKPKYQLTLAKLEALEALASQLIPEDFKYNSL